MSWICKLPLLVLMSLAISAYAQFDGESEEEAQKNDKEGMVEIKPAPKVTDVEIKALSEARKSKDENRVVEAASKILGIDSNHLGALNTLGVFYYETAKPGMAKILFNRALAAHPNVPALHNNLGIVFLAEGKQRQAIASFRRAMQIESSYLTGATNLASIYLEYKDYQKAIDPLENAYKSSSSARKSRDVSAIEVANNYAVALAGTGDLKKAQKVFEELDDLDTKKSEILLNYAILLVERLNSPKEATKLLNKLKFISDDRQVLGRVKDLEEKVRKLEQ